MVTCRLNDNVHALAPAILGMYCHLPVASPGQLGKDGGQHVTSCLDQMEFWGVSISLGLEPGKLSNICSSLLRQVYAAIDVNLNFYLGFDNIYQAHHAASNLGSNELRIWWDWVCVETSSSAQAQAYSDSSCHHGLGLQMSQSLEGIVQ